MWQNLYNPAFLHFLYIVNNGLIVYFQQESACWERETNGLNFNSQDNKSFTFFFKSQHDLLRSKYRGPIIKKIGPENENLPISFHFD